MKKTIIIVSASSDIGFAMCKRWIRGGHSIVGTYRTESAQTEELKKMGVQLIHCDLVDKESVNKAIGAINSSIDNWDSLIIAPGNQEPVGMFVDTDFDEWEKSIQVNFTSQLRFVYGLLSKKNINHSLGPSVLFFAGGGVNNSVIRYSAYTISKIALIKMCELLDAEIPDVRFVIVGPGWVKTKIHEATLQAPEMAGENYHKTKAKIASDEFTPMDDVLDCCDWLIDLPREIMSGRNFSVVFDKWGTSELKKELLNNFNMYRLRREGNELQIKE